MDREIFLVHLVFECFIPFDKPMKYLNQDRMKGEQNGVIRFIGLIHETMKGKRKTVNARNRAARKIFP